MSQEAGHQDAGETVASQRIEKLILDRIEKNPRLKEMFDELTAH